MVVSIFFISNPTWKMIQFDEDFFKTGWNHQLVNLFTLRCWCCMKPCTRCHSFCQCLIALRQHADWCLGPLQQAVFGSIVVMESNKASGDLHCFSSWWNPTQLYMGVSKNRGTPKSSILIGFFLYKPSILGYLYFWKHPYIDHIL